MLESNETERDPSLHEGSHLPDDLPPVEPPSASFILQLFVVPGLIVAAVVAVWVLFGKLATTEQDWRSLMVELENTNPHRRWRAALALAQTLKADQELGDRGQHLAKNPELARVLTQQLAAELKHATPSDDELKYQTYLARTIGILDSPDVVLPVLREAIRPEHDLEVRKNALSAVALIAGRSDAAHPLVAPELIDDLIETSKDDNPLIRQLCGFTLGLFPDAKARERLQVLIQDSDRNTRINAALGLARHDDPHGVPVFKQVLQTATEQQESGSNAAFEQHVALKNCLSALERIASSTTSEDRNELIALVKPIAADYPESRVRIAAVDALKALTAK